MCQRNYSSAETRDNIKIYYSGSSPAIFLILHDLFKIWCGLHQDSVQRIFPPDTQRRTGGKGDHSDGCSPPGLSPVVFLLPAGHAQEESTPEFEIPKFGYLGYIDDDVAGWVDAKLEVVQPGENFSPSWLVMHLTIMKHLNKQVQILYRPLA